MTALSMFGTCLFVVAVPNTAKADERCTPQTVGVSQVIGEADYTYAQSANAEYCNRFATPLSKVTSVIADAARTTRDMTTLFAAVAEAVKERFAVTSEHVHLSAAAMRFRRDANCPVDKKPSGSCFPLGSQAFELQTPASSAFALAPR
ncbi:MAG: hypothetical protein AAB927_02130 [Patescibacteria group bacterium]